MCKRYLRSSRLETSSFPRGSKNKPGVELIFRCEIPTAMLFPLSHTDEVKRLDRRSRSGAGEFQTETEPELQTALRFTDCGLKSACFLCPEVYRLP